MEFLIIYVRFKVNLKNYYKQNGLSNKMNNNLEKLMILQLNLG